MVLGLQRHGPHDCSIISLEFGVHLRLSQRNIDSLGKWPFYGLGVLSSGVHFDTLTQHRLKRSVRRWDSNSDPTRGAAATKKEAAPTILKVKEESEEIDSACSVCILVSKE